MNFIETYNKMDKMKIEVLIVAVFVLSFSKSFSQSEKDFAYDNLNRLTQVIYEGTPQSTVVNYTYDELGNRLTKSVSGFSLQLSVSAFLEGPFNGTDMDTYLTGHPEPVEGFPLSQPYGVSPWNYSGSESVVYVPSTAVDWILVELRDASNAASANGSTMLSRQAAFLTKDGKVVGLDGSSNLIFDETINQDLFVVIWHRNHLGVLSANALTLSDGIFGYDFQSTAEQAYNSGQKDLGGFYGLYAGDANADGQITDSDYMAWKIQAGESGYKSADMNLNGEVENADKNDKWLDNRNVSSQVPE